MSAERKARIAQLEAEAQKLRAEEETARAAGLSAIVNRMTEGLSYDDLVIVKKLVEARVSKAWAHDHDDDE